MPDSSTDADYLHTALSYKSFTFKTYGKECRICKKYSDVMFYKLITQAQYYIPHMEEFML